MRQRMIIDVPIFTYIIVTIVACVLLNPMTCFADAIFKPGGLGKTVFIPSNDSDVTVFTFKPNLKVIGPIYKNNSTLTRQLDALVRLKRYNTAAFIAANTPSKYDDLVVRWVKRNLKRLTPPFYYVLSKKVFKVNKGEGQRWYFIGMVAARVDAKLCTDVSAPQGVVYLAAINKDAVLYSAKKLEKLSKKDQVGTLMNVARYLRGNFNNVSAEWICSHGIVGGRILPASEKSKMLEAYVAKSVKAANR